MSWETERLAFRYVVKRKLSPEKAFKEAVRRTGKKGDLRAFLKFLRDYYYLSLAYPGRGSRSFSSSHSRATIPSFLPDGLRRGPGGSCPRGSRTGSG